nr:hypothetical protein [Streptomyces sp. NRRL F-2580]
MASWPDPALRRGASERSYTGTRNTRAESVRCEYAAHGRAVLRQNTRLSRKPDTWRDNWDAADRLTAVTTWGRRSDGR